LHTTIEAAEALNYEGEEFALNVAVSRRALLKVYRRSKRFGYHLHK
jgi:hypothetical protein